MMGFVERVRGLDDQPADPTKENLFGAGQFSGQTRHQASTPSSPSVGRKRAVRAGPCGAKQLRSTVDTRDSR
jgi:hypothetical protein